MEVVRYLEQSSDGQTLGPVVHGDDPEPPKYKYCSFLFINIIEPEFYLISAYVSFSHHLFV